MNRGRALIAWMVLAVVCWAVIGGVGIILFALLDP
jgi:hypothetical protein